MKPKYPVGRLVHYQGFRWRVAERVAGARGKTRRLRIEHAPCGLSAAESRIVAVNAAGLVRAPRRAARNLGSVSL